MPFVTAACLFAALLGPATPAPAATVAVTIDDLPWVGPVAPGDSREAANDRILAALAAHYVPATGFVVCGHLEQAPTVLGAWHAAGMELGDHTQNHRHIDSLTPPEWKREVAACKTRVAAEVGAPVRWFRYPYLGTGKTAARRDQGVATLRGLGLRVAPVTIDTGEWALAAPYVAARTAGDEAGARAVGDAWVAHVLAAARHYRVVARALLGRDVAHVLLLHANALAADRLGELLTALEGEGFAFVPLATAMRDPVYRMRDHYAGRVGLSWLYRVAATPAEAAWAWDDGQFAAMQRRFGLAADDALVRADHDLTVRPLRPHAWVVVHERPWAANELLVEMGDGTLVLVNTPYTPAAAARLLDWLTARFGPRRLVVINTHFHDDAIGGNAAFQAAGAETWGADRTVALLAERGATLRAAELGWLAARPEEAAELRGPGAAPPAHVFPLEEGVTLRFGDEEVKVVYPGPAHSPDNVVVYFPGLRVLFGGCMVIAFDKVGNLSDADLAHWPAAVEALRPLAADFIIPGHGDRVGPDLLDHTLAVLRAATAPQ